MYILFKIKKNLKNHKMTCDNYCSHPLTVLTVLAKITSWKNINSEITSKTTSKLLFKLI